MKQDRTLNAEQVILIDLADFHEMQRCSGLAEFDIEEMELGKTQPALPAVRVVSRVILEHEPHDWRHPMHCPSPTCGQRRCA